MSSGCFKAIYFFILRSKKKYTQRVFTPKKLSSWIRQKTFFIDSGQRFKKVRRQIMKDADGHKDESPEKTREDVSQIGGGSESKCRSHVVLCCQNRKWVKIEGLERFKSRISNKASRDLPGFAHAEEEEIGERCGKEGFVSTKS